MLLLKQLSKLEPKVALVIGGLDPTTGAGVYMDVKTLSVIKVLPLVAATCVVFENTHGVRGILPISSDAVRTQIKMSLDDCYPQAIKVSMIYNRENAEAIADEVPKGIPIVLDPVLESWDGYKLITHEGLETMKKILIPRSTVITPNALEASILSGVKVSDLNSAKEAAKKIADLGVKYVVIKGGHLSLNKVIDILYYEEDFLFIEKERSHEEAFHGLGCTFAASLTGFIAHGLNVVDAFKQASSFMDHALRGSYKLRGRARLSNPLEIYYKSLDVIKVLDDVYEALTDIETTSGLENLTPEVSVNIIECLRNPITLDDVCGIEGRLRPVRGFLRAYGTIMFGASKHLGSMLIEVNKRWPSIRACMNIKYSEEVLEAIKALGLKVALFDRSKEPKEVKEKEGLSMKWGAQEALKGLPSEPDIIYDLGDVGKEPMIRVFGKDAIDVVKKVKLISAKLKELQEPSRS